MARTVVVYGSSDDLLEIDGDFSEEYGVYEKSPRIAFSDGTVLSVEYDEDGCWRIKRTEEGKASFLHVPAVDADADRREDGTPGYSDVVTLTGDIEWLLVDGEKKLLPVES